MPNIIDNMDQARFKSKNQNQNNRLSKKEEEQKNMPTVLKNLKNGS